MLAALQGQPYKFKESIFCSLQSTHIERLWQPQVQRLVSGDWFEGEIILDAECWVRPKASTDPLFPLQLGVRCHYEDGMWQYGPVADGALFVDWYTSFSEAVAALYREMSLKPAKVGVRE